MHNRDIQFKAGKTLRLYVTGLVEIKLNSGIN